MKRRASRSVAIGLVSQMAAVAILTGCGEDHRLDEMAQGPSQAQVCADKDGVIVTDDMCKMPAPAGTPQAAGGAGGGVYPYHWYYYPHQYGGYGVGNRIPPTATRTAPAPGLTAQPNSQGFKGFSSAAPRSSVSSPSTSSGPRSGGFGLSGGSGSSGS